MIVRIKPESIYFEAYAIEVSSSALGDSFISTKRMPLVTNAPVVAEIRAIPNA